MSKNFVQEHQFLLELSSAVPTSVLHVQGQRGSTVAETQKNQAPQCIDANLQKHRERIIPSNPQTVEGTKLELCILLSCRASKTQIGRRYVLQSTQKTQIH